MKKFQDEIKIIDKKPHQSDFDGNKDLIINNDFMAHSFPFEISYTNVVIDKDILILCVGDEGIKLNKVFAFFESYLCGNGKIRTKDINFTGAWMRSHNMWDKEELIRKYPTFNILNEINATWELAFSILVLLYKFTFKVLIVCIHANILMKNSSFNIFIMQNKII